MQPQMAEGAFKQKHANTKTTAKCSACRAAPGFYRKQTKRLENLAVSTCFSAYNYFEESVM